MSAGNTPTPALLSRVGLRSFLTSPAYSAIGEPGAKLLAFARARGDANGVDDTYGILMAIEDGSERSTLLGEVARMEQPEGVESSAAEPALPGAEDGWYVAGSSVITPLGSRDTTLAIEWGATVSDGARQECHFWSARST